MALSIKLPGPLDPNRRKRINRAPSPVLAYTVPWLSVILASAASGWITIAAAPVVPPFGFLVLVGWRQLRPGLLPAWAGLPLGLFDDCVSGQPAGSAVLLWSLALLALDMIEARWPWRNFVIEWAVATVLIALYLFAGALIASGADPAGWFPAVAAQIAVSVLGYPIAARVVAQCDRLRLARLRKLG
jgi:rod shape-determining protein MreD